ncbi:MAG: exopolysaccharide biosynthesis protein, partial [Jannaschia helgolandensis]
ERLVGVVCLLMSLLLVMPIPLMNAPPAIAIACMSWGLVQRDGVFVGIGIAVSIGVLVSILIFADLILNALTA